MRAESLRQQLSVLEGQRELIVDLVGEVTRTRATLDAIVDKKDGDEVLIPIGAGTFIHARLAQVGTAITSIGSGVSTQADIAGSRQRISDRLENLQATHKRLATDIQQVTHELTQLNAALESQGA